MGAERENKLGRKAHKPLYVSTHVHARTAHGACDNLVRGGRFAPTEAQHAGCGLRRGLLGREFRGSQHHS